MSGEVTEGNQVSMVSEGGLGRYRFLLPVKKKHWLLNTLLKDFAVKSALLSENMVLNTY